MENEKTQSNQKKYAIIFLLIWAAMLPVLVYFLSQNIPQSGTTEEDKIKEKIVEIEKDLYKNYWNFYTSSLYAQTEEWKEVAKGEEKKSQWSYSKTKDELRGTERYIAKISSENKERFAFPYEWWQSLGIMLRNWNNKNDVMITITEGQFKSSYRWDEYISVRFDDSAVQKFYYFEPEDHSSDIIFLTNAESFVRQIRTAKKVIIEAPFYQNWRSQFTFSVEWVDF